MREMMKNNLVLCLLSGLLLVISFPITGSIFPLAFLAWIPLLAVEYHFSGSRFSGWKVLFFSYITFFIYNLGTTWWIYYASEDGALLAFFANSLLMAIAFTIYHLLNKLLGRSWWMVSFICVWLTFELLHFHWELSWPWLTLGNVFASSHYLVQWYSITGVFGGSLWILLINCLIFNLLIQQKQKQLKNWVPTGIVLLVPIIVSLAMYGSKNTKGKTYNVTILQPNVDPYNEKFTGSNTAQLADLLALADKVNKKNTKLIIAPETALYPNIEYSSDFLVVDKLPYHAATRAIKKYQLTHPIPLLIGGSTYEFFDKEHSAASNLIQPGVYQESYNSSLLFDLNKNPQVIHKSKLVLGVEKIPFISTIPFLKTMAIDLGGSSGSIADHPSVFKSKTSTFAPVVCYESVYGEFVSEQCTQNANFIAIITNDGWWRDTPGYKQHFLFAGLRAIENNRWIARSANTGKSGVFNNRGDVVAETGWWKETSINKDIQLISGKTLYQKFGDLIPRVASGVLIILFLLAIYNRFRRRNA
jgi:apolipoprotein N-acyltransferase